MIEFTKAFKTSDGQTFASLEHAQISELNNLFKDRLNLTSEPELVFCDKFVGICIEETEKICDILTTTPTSKPKARKVNGGKKMRKQAPECPAPAP